MNIIWLNYDNIVLHNAHNFVQFSPILHEYDCAYDAFGDVRILTFEIWDCAYDAFGDVRTFNSINATAGIKKNINIMH